MSQSLVPDDLFKQLKALSDRLYRLEQGAYINGDAVVTSLPSAPVDGMIIDFLADDTNGIVWHLKYREAEVGAFKWYYLGGPPLILRVAGARSITSVPYAAVPTDGSSLTLPVLAGDYDIEAQATVIGPGALDAAYYSYAVGATAANDAWAAPAGFSSDAGAAKRHRHTGVASAAVIAERARVSAGTGNVSERRLIVWPVRVG